MKISFWEKTPSSVEVCRTSGSAMPAKALSRWILPALLILAGTFITTQTAKADSFTFAFSGGGISGSGVITVSPTATPGTDTITGISGFFSDTNANFSGAITGLEFAPPPSSPPPFPAPAFTAGSGFSYDNLFYPGGDSPLVCPPETPGGPPGYPFDGGVLDIYGVAFDVAGGYTVDLWSNGVVPGAGLTYEVSDALGSTLLEPDDEGAAVPVSVSTSPVPEPGSLLLLGTGLFGLVDGLRRRSKRSVGLDA